MSTNQIFFIFYIYHETELTFKLWCTKCSLNYCVQSQRPHLKRMFWFQVARGVRNQVGLKKLPYRCIQSSFSGLLQPILSQWIIEQNTIYKTEIPFLLISSVLSLWRWHSTVSLLVGQSSQFNFVINFSRTRILPIWVKLQWMNTYCLMLDDADNAHSMVKINCVLNKLT